MKIFYNKVFWSPWINFFHWCNSWNFWNCMKTFIFQYNCLTFWSTGWPQHSTAQHSTAQHSKTHTAQHSIAQHSTAQQNTHSTIQHSTAQHTQHSTAQHSKHSTAQHSTAHTAQHSTAQHSIDNPSSWVPDKSFAPVIWINPHPGHSWEKEGTITSYSPACVSLRGRVNTCFHFFVAWFSDGLKLSRGGSEQTTSSHLKIRLTPSSMSRGFTFNLSVVTFLCHLVIWTFDINYLCSSWLQFFPLEMLFNV